MKVSRAKLLGMRQLALVVVLAVSVTPAVKGTCKRSIFMSCRGEARRDGARRQEEGERERGGGSGGSVRADRNCRNFSARILIRDKRRP